METGELSGGLLKLNTQSPHPKDVVEELLTVAVVAALRSFSLHHLERVGKVLVGPALEPTPTCPRGGLQCFLSSSKHQISGGDDVTQDSLVRNGADTIESIPLSEDKIGGGLNR